MKPRILFLFCFWATALSAQVVDRYPYVQAPTETAVTIAFNTGTAGIGTLNYGTSAGALNNTLTDTASVQKHAFRIEGLQPNTQYFYEVSTNSGFSSGVEHFWTARPVEIEEVSFLHYGDCGYDNQVQNDISALMETEDVDFAVVTGDVDQLVGDNYDGIYFGVYKNMLARDCHFTAIGNHDIIANNGSDFFDAFYQPRNNPQGVENYYSFTWGNAKFIALDSNSDYSPGSDQHNFLIDEISCNDFHWIFVFFHHPPWTNAWDPLYYVPFQEWYEYDGEDDMRTDLVPYFEQYDVDFILNGHSHCYQRGSLNGVEYVISGGAGTSTPDDETCNTFPNYNSCAPNIQKGLYINQYVRFDIHGDTATYICIDINGNVVDSVTRVKPFTPYENTVTVNDPSGPGANDGSATSSATGPHPPYTYSWSNGASGGTATGLGDGVYYVTVTDAFGCAHIDTVYVGNAVSVDGGLQDLHVKVLRDSEYENCTFVFNRPGHVALRFELFGLDGKRLRVLEGITGEQFRIGTGDLAAGVYAWRLSGGGFAAEGKLWLD